MIRCRIQEEKLESALFYTELALMGLGGFIGASFAIEYYYNNKKQCAKEKNAM